MEFQDTFNAANGGNHMPPVLGISELSILLKKSPAVILADRCRAPHRVPPSCEPPGTRQPLWLLEDVLNWLRQYQKQPAPQPAPARRGRPTKREQLERARAAQQAAEGGAA